MISMQYKITLPNDYDMDNIRNRVSENGKKTDGFNGLLFKAYLIIDDPLKKQYAPFYIWKNSVGMNQFIFEGFYDNILQSFGWQTIAIAVPYKVDVSEQVSESKFVVEIEHPIQEAEKMKSLSWTLPKEKCLGKVMVYNPDKWKYVEFYFYENVPVNKGSYPIYEVLHLSKGV